MSSYLINLLFLLMFMLSIGSTLSIAQPEGIPDGFESIFNGEDLTGWHISRTNHHGTVGNFYVEDGMIVMKQYPYGQGGIILTDKRYADFELYLEVKADPGTNGGLFFRSNETGSAYQIEIEGDGQPNTANLISEMLRTTTRASAEGLQEVWVPGDWNSFRLRVTGDVPHAILWVNGVLMWNVKMERNDLIADAREGMIALQLHWSQTPTPVPGGSCCAYSWRPDGAHYFRNIAIKEL